MSFYQNSGCLGFLLRFFGGSSSSSEWSTTKSFPYRVRDDFLSPSELSFYHVLLGVLDGHGIVSPKVNLSDVLFMIRPHENRSAYNRIAQKHVDFLVCDSQRMKPLFGVELDDASHGRPDRQRRDAFVEEAFAAAGLPLLRVPAQRGHSLPELSALIAPLLAAVPVSPVAAATQGGSKGEELPPLCPKCGVPMVVRVAGRGERSGQQFFGCPNYPKCRETRPLVGA